jgi:hypothetical protein
MALTMQAAMTQRSQEGSERCILLDISFEVDVGPLIDDAHLSVPCAMEYPQFPGQELG